MAALPLTLETLKTPSNESLLSLQSPLMSPRCIKADSLSTIDDIDATSERPSNLTIVSTQQYQQQQHSNITPSSSATTLHGNISPAFSSAGSLSPSFLPEMPQWKRDLIERRRQNVQRTISASSPTSSSSSSAIALVADGGLKTSISSSSMRSLLGSNTNIDQLTSDGVQKVCSTKDYNKTSLLPFANTTTKVNKQYNTTNSTNTVKPAANIKSSTTLSSPLKEKAEKLFGGQYTVTTSSSLSPSPSTTIAATLSTKEEITTHQQQQREKLKNKECKEKQVQENNKMMEENQEEHFEMYKKTKEVLNDETQTTTTTAIVTNKQQMATRLTGSTYNITTTNTSGSSSSSPSSSSSILKRVETDREKLINITTQQYHNISGANANLVNQSLNKCESERLVCAADTTGNSNNLNNTNNSVTIGGISVSGNISNNQNNCSSVTSVVKISQKLQENQFIKNEQQLNTKKIIKFKQNTTSGGGCGIIPTDLKSPTKISHVLPTSSSTSCLTTTTSSSSSLHSTVATSSTNCAIKKKMVAVQEMKKSTQNTATHLHPITSTWHATNRANNRGGGSGVGGGGGGGVDGGGDTDLDNSEDLSYGPGIVSKLRCRYLSLALRESKEQQRLNKDQLRRSTSLNNLLDNTEDDEICDEDEEIEDIADEDVENQGFAYKVVGKEEQNGTSNIVENKKAGILKTSVNNGQDKRFSHNSQGSNGVGVTFTETSYNKRSRHLKRGNDSLKRARSVEALLSEKSPWHTKSTPTCVTIEDKIHNARERLHQGTDHMPPKRLTSIIDDTERPPPDLVKQTLKMFEATANRRPRSTNRSNSKGDVASKVETFKNIIKEQKPVVTFPKPLSPTKKVNTPTLNKPLKASTPQANDLLQSPLGRKTMAAVTSVINTNDCLTSLKTNNTLSDQTPDIIPRQKFNSERDFKQNEIFSSKQKFLSQEIDMESPLVNIKRDYSKEKFEVDSPITALSKQLSKLKLKDTTTIRKSDNSSVGSSTSSSSDNHEPVNNVGSIGGVGGGGGDSNGGDACQRHNKYPYNNSNNDFVNEETTQKELISTSSLKANSSPSSTTIETKNEATVNNYDSLTKASSPPPSSSDLSDVGENYDDDEYGGLKTTKRITRTALDNIAKAGYTQQFKFNTTSQTNSSTAATNSTASSLNTGKQIGVIRPLPNTQQQQQQQQKSPENNMESIKHSTNTSLTSQEIEKNRINDLKKSSTSCATNAAASSSPSASLDHQMIKPSYTSSPLTSSSATATNSATGVADVDSVISATNSPLWAMRKRRQTPPAAPAENTSMVFNFSNRKEVPDYIENDGVIFRRKRELPKPNESGFVLLGDLSVETSTDMDYDDFAMCPPSPCDVEFVNANIVIDGKSSIRQKSKDITFRVQFDDTLTSTFEYPSEASLIVDESFSAYNESYAQPLHSTSANDDFTYEFQNLNLENATHLHVADEIIQLPTLNSTSPAAANTTNSPTKNILGNLPLDYPDLQKGIQLTTATIQQTQLTSTQGDKGMLKLVASDKKKSRKDLKLELGLQPSQQRPTPQKPAVPIKRCQLMNQAAAGVLNLKNSPRNLKACEINKQQKKVPIGDQQHVENANQEVSKAQLPQQRKTPRVLNNPQYACFLRATTLFATKPIQRSRSNEFHKGFATISVSATVSRSNSLRNLEYVPANRTNTQFNQSLAVDATLNCFSAEVNSHEYLNNHVCKEEKAKNPSAFQNPATPQILNNAKDNGSNLKNPLFPNAFPEIKHNNQSLNDKRNERSQSLNNLVANSQSVLSLRETFSKSVDNISCKSASLLELKRLKNSTGLVARIVENSNNITKTNSKQSKIPKKFNKNTPETATSTAENPQYTASLQFKFNQIDTGPATLPKDARNREQTLHDYEEKRGYRQNLPQKSQDVSKSVHSQKKSEQITNFSKPKESFPCKPPTKSHYSLILNNENYLGDSNSSKSLSEHEKKFSLGNSLKHTENQLNYCYRDGEELPPLPPPPSKLYTTESSFGKVSLTVNSKYVTEYRSKITENLPNREIKSMENLTLQNPSDFLHTHKALKASLSLAVDEHKTNEYCTSIPENLLNKTRKSLHRVVKGDTHSKSQDDLGKKPCRLPIKATFTSNENFSDIIEYSLYRNINSLAPESLNGFSNNREGFKLTETLDCTSKSVDNIATKPNRFYLTESKDMNEQDSDNFQSLDNDINTGSQLKINVTNNSVNNLTKSLQMSIDSLDNFEDAEEINEGKLVTDLEASEILEDIAIGLDASSLFDFNNLLTLKKSKTVYCLQSLEKSASLESKDNDNSLQSDENNFISACNTLESKCPLKPREIAIAEKTSSSATSERKPPELPLKKAKTLRLKTTEKILNLTNMASQNVAAYATFRKSKNFYKNASKSFKNSLRFYETFSAKTAQTMATTQSPIKRSFSLSENPIKKAELNRKIFAKSSKIMMKVRNADKWDSPTENSYSFEYFDAEGDINGNLVNMGNTEINDNDKINANDNIEIKKYERNLSGTKPALADEILFSQKSINLKPKVSDFYFNTSPRPFKRIYETTTIVDIKESDIEPTKSEKPIAEKDCTIFLQNSESIKPKLFPTPTAINSIKIFKDKYDLNYYQDSGDYCFDKFSTLSTPSAMMNSPIQRANSFTTFNGKPDLNNCFQKSYPINISQKHIAQTNSLQNDDDNRNNNSGKSFRSVERKFPKFETFSKKIFETAKTDAKLETFIRYADACTEFSFDLVKFSANSPKFADNSSPVTDNFKNITRDSSPKYDEEFSVNSSACPTKSVNSPTKQKLSNFPENTATSVENLTISAPLSSNNLTYSKYDKQHNNVTLSTTTSLPTTTLTTVNDYYKKSITTTPTTICTITTTTPTTTTTNFPSKVVAIKNAKASNVSYKNSSCSFSSVRTTNKSYATAKYHQNQKVPTIATKTTTTAKTTTTFIPAPPLKSITAKNPPKVLPRRLVAANAPKTATTKTTTTTTTTTTCDTISSTTTSSNYFYASSNCTSGNNSVASLRRRSAPLGFYTPLKAPIDRLFQLGVTRAPSLLSNNSPTDTTANGTLLNGFGDDHDGDFGYGNGSIVGISGSLIKADYDEQKKISDNNADEEPESLQYIKPAEDDLNMAYSEGTQKTDLLY